MTPPSGPGADSYRVVLFPPFKCRFFNAPPCREEAPCRIEGADAPHALGPRLFAKRPPRDLKKLL